MTFKAGARVLEGVWLQQCDKPSGGSNLYEVWDAGWASTKSNKWEGGKPPWRDVPKMVIYWDEIESTHVEVRDASRADCQGVDRTVHPGKAAHGVSR